MHFGFIPAAYLASAIILSAASLWLVPRCKDAHIAMELRVQTVVHVTCSVLVALAYLLSAAVEH